jgi:selenocysteine lyase/cysteine desulfurase
MSIPATVGAPVRAALERFPAVHGHLDAATAGVPPLAAVEAARDALAEWSEGRLDAPGYDAAVRRARTAFARLVGVDPADVACGPQVSVFAGLVAATIPAGAEVIVARGDFASVRFPMLVQEPRGVRVREVELERLAEAISSRTSVVAVSAVQSADGRVIDLDALARAADHHGARVFLDATQAAGWLPIAASRFAYVAAGAYKWLLSPRGSAFLAVRPANREQLIPHTAGWYSAEEPWNDLYGPLRLARDARALDVSPAWVCWAGTAPAVELIAELGVESLYAYDLELAARLREGLGLEPYPSAIVSLDRPDAAARLARAGVRASVRSGRVRLSCHPPATLEDVERAITALT